MKRFPQSFAAILIALFCSSCFVSRASVNEPLDRTLIKGLQPGSTTAVEVAELLGAPNQVVQLGLRSAWLYEFGLGKRTGLTFIVVTFSNNDTREDRIWVFFDEEDVLTHYGTTFQAKGSSFAMPWQRVKPTPIDEDAVGEDAEDPAEGE